MSRDTKENAMARFAADPDPVGEEISRLFAEAWPLSGRDRDDETFLAQVDALEAAHGPTIPARILWHFTRHFFDTDRAQAIWKAARANQSTLSQALGQPIDLRVPLHARLVEEPEFSSGVALVTTEWVQQVESAACRDATSGLSRLIYLQDCLPRDIVRADRALEMLTVLAIEVDGTPECISALSPARAQRLIEETTRQLKDCIRTSDHAFGGSGGRFAVVLAGTPKDEALRVAERFRLRVPKALADLQSEADPPWKVSVGVAAFPGDAREGAALWARALEALGAARSAGGNRSWLFGDDRRSSHRVEVDLPCSVQVLGDAALPATLVNLSEMGCRLVAERAFTKGTLVEVTILLSEAEAEAEAKTTTCTGRVVWTVESKDGRVESAIRITALSARDRYRTVEFLEKLRRPEKDED